MIGFNGIYHSKGAEESLDLDLLVPEFHGHVPQQSWFSHDFHSFVGSPTAFISWLTLAPYFSNF
jgi:hypothetical protein